VVDYVYPSVVELQTIAQEYLPRLMEARPVFDIFPTRDVDSHLLEWEQRDNYLGLQQVRGLNGEPNRVKPIGGKAYQMKPGVYGEYALIDEDQLTQRRQWGSFGSPINIEDLVMEKQNQLLVRRLDRIEKMLWDLLVTGTFSVADGAMTLHTDTYTEQTYSAGVAWGTAATSTPLADLRAVQLKARGLSVNFGVNARLYMNRVTLNQVLNNTNAADLGGRRVAGFQTINGPQALTQILAAEDLPSFVVYDEGYYDDAGAFQLFIPNNKAVLVGSRRDGDPVGEYRYTRNANNMDLAPGPYMRVIDDPDQIPRSIQVHDGHNGGPVMFHPAAIVVMTV
jgi:hypothetical protein